MDYDKLLNYLERKTADSHELQAASAIIGLRQRVAVLEKERDEWRGKHDVACCTITNLQAKYECQLAATSKAMEGVAKLTAERDAAIKSYVAQVTTINTALGEDHGQAL